MVDVPQLQATRASLPKGLFVGPTLPASTVDGTNNSGYDLRCRISAGTVTVVAVDGVVLGAVTTNEWFYVRNGSTFNITYSVAPTLQWFIA
jgi:hypothetical protein